VLSAGGFFYGLVVLLCSRILGEAMLLVSGDSGPLGGLL